MRQPLSPCCWLVKYFRHENYLEYDFWYVSYVWKLGPTEHLEARNNLVAHCSFVPRLQRTIRVGIKVAHPSIIGPWPPPAPWCQLARPFGEGKRENSSEPSQVTGEWPVATTVAFLKRDPPPKKRKHWNVLKHVLKQTNVLKHALKQTRDPISN